MAQAHSSMKEAQSFIVLKVLIADALACFSSAVLTWRSRAQVGCTFIDGVWARGDGVKQLNAIFPRVRRRSHVTYRVLETDSCVCSPLHGINLVYSTFRPRSKRPLIHTYLPPRCTRSFHRPRTLAGQHDESHWLLVLSIGRCTARCNSRPRMPHYVKNRYSPRVKYASASMDSIVWARFLKEFQTRGSPSIAFERGRYSESAENSFWRRVALYAA